MIAENYGFFILLDIFRNSEYFCSSPKFMFAHKFSHTKTFAQRRRIPSFFSCIEFSTMRVKTLRSWKITTSEPFYPVNLQCVPHNDTVAVTTYAPHQFHTFIVRNFREVIDLDKPVHKSFLHDTIYPERIVDVANGSAESAILLDNGRVKHFETARHLESVAYLQGVKSICRSSNGFALIRMSDDGTEFFMDLHPAEFHVNQIDNRKVFNISFDKIPELQSTWHQTLFKIKELQLGVNGVEFLKMLLPDEAGTDQNELKDTSLFLAMDYSFCSVHVVNGEPMVNPIVQCTSKIVDFWAGNKSPHILLLLENGAMEILYMKEQSTEIARQNLYFGSELMAFRYINGAFYYSNGFAVQYGPIEYNEDQAKFIFTRKTVELPGIAGIDVLPQFNVFLCISENCQFYAIQMQTETESEWIEVDGCAKRQLANIKSQVLELTDSYDELLEQQKQQQNTIDTIKLKRSTLKSEEHQKYRFVATCKVARSLDFTHSDDLMRTINVPSALAYDRNRSFFVQIGLTTVNYANEFDSDVWHLKCGWSNDRHENEYANCRLANRELLAPIRLIVHLQQQHLPAFRLSIATIVRTSGSLIEVNFPARVEQPDYAVLMRATKCESMSVPGDIHLNEIVGTIFVPKIVSMEHLLGDKLKIEGDLKKSTGSTKSTCYSVHLLDRRLIAVHNSELESLELRTSDPDLMYLFKRFIYHRIEMQLNTLQCDCNVQISNNALQEYLVSASKTRFFPLILSIDGYHWLIDFDSFTVFSLNGLLCFVREQSASNHLNGISSATDRIDKYGEMLQCIGKVRRMPLLSSKQQ